MTDPYDYLKRAIEKSLALALRGVCFNVLTKNTSSSRDTFFAYKKEKVCELLSEMNLSNFLREGYLDNDITFYIEKAPKK